MCASGFLCKLSSWARWLCYCLVDCSWRGLRLLPDGLQHNVLPGSLDRLPKLTHMYLHANRFSMLPFGVLDKLTSLKVITLGNNPWGCRSYSDINYLLSWTQHTPAKVLGCPCHTQSDLRTVTPRTSGYPFKGHHPASAHPDTFIHMFHTTSPPVPGTNIHSPPDSFHVTGTSSFSIRTETAAEADVSVSTEKFSTTNKDKRFFSCLASDVFAARTRKAIAHLE
uniref:Oligodendrocyte-myelin glycoprotein n=1 Tax=Cynoglossus semilaevis TaxID=244447 RepID=A0A3P8W103_CYNSE